MSPNLDQKLCEEFPSIFRNRNADETESCMHWGFECGDGWYNIIRGVCLAVTNNYSTSRGLELDGRPLPEGMSWKDPAFDSYFWHYKGCDIFIADQVKEKYGTLRFYYHLEWSPENQKMAELYPKTAQLIATEQRQFVKGIIDMAETMSSITCEETGLIGELHISGGWLKTLNVDFAKNDEWCKSRDYVPYSTVKKHLP